MCVRVRACMCGGEQGVSRDTYTCVLRCRGRGEPGYVWICVCGGEQGVGVVECNG